MTVLSDIQRQLAEQLLISVLKKEPTVLYSELAERVDPPLHPRNVGHNIGQVSRLCHELGLPLISAKVTNKNTKTAGMGFFALYKMLGIPTRGKSEAELFHEELKAIRTCDEWYKLEEHLGLHIGMPRPSGAPASLLNARRPIAYAKSVDVLNACFGERILGRKYDGWQRGALTFTWQGVEYTVWFPKLPADGEAASGSGWVNRISPNGMTMEEFGGTPYEGYTGERLVFAKKGNGPYTFCGAAQMFPTWSPTISYRSPCRGSSAFRWMWRKTSCPCAVPATIISITGRAMIKALYERRKKALETVGIRVTLDELLSFYT